MLAYKVRGFDVLAPVLQENGDFAPVF